MKEERDERLFKERTVDNMRNEVTKEEPVQPGTFSAFSFKKRTNFKKPQIRQRINENDYCYESYLSGGWRSTSCLHRWCYYI